MKLTHPFIRLPFRFDISRLKQELSQFDDSAWMAHPSRINGNSAIPLVSLNGLDNDNFSGEMRPTKHLGRCDYIRQIMANFNEVIARSRLMKLAAGAEVTEHVDFNYHWYDRVRIHIPITTTPEVSFYCDNEVVNMGAGECWIFDSWRKHKVVNQSAFDRVHLVVDTAGSARFWNMVESMSRFAPDFQSKEFNSHLNELNYVPAHNAQPKTERFNVAPVMAPGELEAIARELIIDVGANPDNNVNLVKEYRELLNDLAKDWRETWLLYGYDSAGVDQYRSILNRTAKRLRPNPRALVTASNNVGVNPIIMQRILRAALNVDQLPRFKT